MEDGWSVRSSTTDWRGILDETDAALPRCNTHSKNQERTKLIRFPQSITSCAINNISLSLYFNLLPGPRKSMTSDRKFDLFSIRALPFFRIWNRCLLNLENVLQRRTDQMYSDEGKTKSRIMLGRKLRRRIGWKPSEMYQNRGRKLDDRWRWKSLGECENIVLMRI